MTDLSGSSIERMALDRLLADAVGPGGIPGVIGVVGDRRGALYLEGFGSVDVRTGAPMDVDSLLRIASLSKAVCAIATMQLVERGLLELDTPVGELLPAYDDLMVLDGFDGDRPRLRRPRVRGTVRHLLNHTSGLAYDAFDRDLVRYGEVTGVPMSSSGLLSSLTNPFVCEPGSAFAYGLSTDWTGRVVEAVSGMELEEYFVRNIFDPLSIADISFSPSAAQRERLAPVHLVGEDGTSEVMDFEYPTRDEREFDQAGHGLYATAADYLTIQRVLLGGGEVDGVRLLTSGSVAQMFANQVGDLAVGPLISARPEFSRDVHLPPGCKWGLDLLVTEQGRPGMRAAGSAGWCGTFNSYYWIDPRTGVTGALHAQYLPFYDARAVDLFEAFERAVYAGLRTS